MRQAEVRTDQARRDAACRIAFRHSVARAGKRGDQHQCENAPNRLHASPPARSASGCDRDPELFPSTFLYHDISAAAAIITRMPRMLRATCAATRDETCSRVKSAANAKNTPSQNTYSE